MTHLTGNRDDQPFRGLEPDHYRRSGLKDAVKPLPFATQSTHIDCATSILK
jgi:hypothetical protein